VQLVMEVVVLPTVVHLHDVIWSVFSCPEVFQLGSLAI
jgi:hypothetical protein